MNIIFFRVIYLNTSSIAGWNMNEVLLLVFICGFVDSVHSFFFASGFISIPNMIRDGQLDFVLLKPINKRFYLAFRLTNIGQLFNIVFNLTMIIIYLIKLSEAFDFLKVFMFFMLIGIGILIVNAFYFTLSMIAFWVIQVNAIIGYSQELFTIGNKPLSIYPQVIQKIFIYLIPLGIAFSYPILYYSKKLDWIDVTLAFIIATLFFGFSHFLYRKGFKRYTSASS
ncbi:MAG: ABC-2 family transporter protein [Lachnospiraceae bacterium]|nr:ABC-2 family transporter protein [Lachnospiraceae bacterium]